MELDGNQLAARTILKIHTAVIGSGAAGITIARELAGTATQVMLIEAGGYEYDHQLQSAYEAEAVTTNTESVLDLSYPRWSRLRHFGGSTGHWGGWSCPLEEYDFEPRSWVAGSGWPFARRELIPYYDRACGLVEIPKFDFARPSESSLFTPSKDYDQIFAGNESSPDLEQRYFSYSPPTHFGIKYRQELQQSANVTVTINANVIRLDMDSFHERIEKLICRNQNGTEFEIHAEVFILACGGLENPRLLLNSNHQAAAGLCNQYDLVGRYFLEHPHTMFATLMNVRGRDWMQSFIASGAGQSKRIFTTTPEFQQKNQTMSYSCEVMTSGDQPADASLVRQLTPLMSPTSENEVYCTLNVRADMEPNANNRVSIGLERDWLGLQKIKMNVNFSRTDLDSIRRSTEAVMAHLSFLGLGRAKLKMATDELWPGSVWIGCHHMGTTRMAVNPRQGVVDADCKAHGLANLYIAGSSVFTTGGYGNPTLTIVAMALRLSDHLKARCK